jgi:hypothetical protein
MYIHTERKREKNASADFFFLGAIMGGVVPMGLRSSHFGREK